MYVYHSSKYQVTIMVLFSELIMPFLFNKFHGNIIDAKLINCTMVEIAFSYTVCQQTITNILQVIR
jgi:transposase